MTVNHFSTRISGKYRHYIGHAQRLTCFVHLHVLYVPHRELVSAISHRAVLPAQALRSNYLHIRLTLREVIHTFEGPTQAI